VGPRAVLTILGVLLLAVAGVLLVLESGGGDEAPAERESSARPAPDPPDDETQASLVEEDVDPDALRFARALAAGFERVTGDGLRLEPGEFFTSATFDDRTLDEHGQADAYYGNFLLYVYPNAREAREVVESDGRWSSYGAGYYGRTALGNIVVQSVFEKRRTDAGWQRLLRALRAARTGPGRDTGLPASERLCSRRGIELDSGPTGTCKRGPQLWAIRDRRMGLRLPGLSIEEVRVRSGPRFGGRDGFPEEAKGVFVELRFRMRNTGRRPIDLRPGYELLLGGRRFEEATAVYGLRDRYPLKPGEEDSEVCLFDVPRGLAEDLREAAFRVPGDPTESFDVADALMVGHLRLAGPVGRLRVQPEREPPALPPPPPEPEPEPPPGVPRSTPA
jgi:hypothetical protein